MKRLVMLVAMGIWLVTSQGQAQAQERDPLVMEVMFEWSLAGALVGAGVGFGLWLTDPGNPNNEFKRSVIEGTSWGVVAGTLFGMYIINRAILLPGQTAWEQPGAPLPDPLAPQNRELGPASLALAEHNHTSENLRYLLPLGVWRF